MKHLSLFSGIGGLDLAAEWAGFETVAFVERDPYCQRVLAKRWPGVPIIGDVRDVVADTFGPRELQPEGREPDFGRRAGDSGEATGGADWQRARLCRDEIAIVSGGFPCQPHSVAGKRQASADDRDLWPEFARVIRAIRPRWVVAENVPGLLHSESGRFFGSVLGDLADMGYSAGWGVWGAADVGALHRRERVFIVAHAGYEQARRAAVAGEAQGRRPLGHIAGRGKALADTNEQGSQGRHRGDRGNSRAERLARPRGPFAPGKKAGPVPWESEPDVGRVAHGVPSRVDRLRALGNAVVPQQAYPLFKAIAEIEMSDEFQKGGPQ